jgi:hypothetical protein
MTPSASEIAEQMRAAAHDQARSREVLTGLFAESVEIRHVPRHPNDGPIAGRLLSEVARRESEAAMRALPDVLPDAPDISVEGDAIRVRRRTIGTLSDGTAVDVKTNTIFTIAGGVIVALQSEMDPASIEAWQKVLAAGGFEATGRQSAP